MLDLRDLDVPVVAAPMAGGPTTPALAAAVSAAGGLGFLGAGYKSADDVAADIEAVRAATSAPLGVNLFVLEPYEPDAAALEAYRRSLEAEAARLGVELGEPRWDDDHWQAKLDVVCDLRPDVVSFTFGCPSSEVLARLTQQGIHCAVTVTCVAEAEMATARGATSLAAQGPGAGGHRGTWDLDALPDATALPELIAAVVEAVALPVVAGGGVMTSTDVASVLARGATAALVGTAYLLADEAATNPTHRKALRDPSFADTAVTRAYTGRWARGLANRFIAEHATAPAGYPHLHHLTSPIRRAAAAAGDAQTAHMWAGTGHALARPAPAAEITRSLTP